MEETTECILIPTFEYLNKLMEFKYKYDLLDKQKHFLISAQDLMNLDDFEMWYNRITSTKNYLNKLIKALESWTPNVNKTPCEIVVFIDKYTMINDFQYKFEELNKKLEIIFSDYCNKLIKGDSDFISDMLNKYRHDNISELIKICDRIILQLRIFIDEYRRSIIRGSYINDHI